MTETTDSGTSRWNRLRNTFDATNRFRDNITPTTGSEHGDRIPRAPQPVNVKPQGSRPDTERPSRLQTQYGNYGPQSSGGRTSQPQGSYQGEGAHQPQHPYPETGSMSQPSYGSSNQYHQNQGYASQPQYGYESQPGYQQSHQNDPRVNYTGYPQSSQSTGSQYHNATEAPYRQGPRMEDQRSSSYGSARRESSDRWSQEQHYSSPISYSPPAAPFSAPAAAPPPAAGYTRPEGGYFPPAHDPRPYQGLADPQSRRGQTTPNYDPGARDDIISSHGARQARQLSQPQPQGGYGYPAYPSNYNPYDPYQNSNRHGYN